MAGCASAVLPGEPGAHTTNIAAASASILLVYAKPR